MLDAPGSIQEKGDRKRSLNTPTTFLVRVRHIPGTLYGPRLPAVSHYDRVEISEAR